MHPQHRLDLAILATVILTFVHVAVATYDDDDTCEWGSDGDCDDNKACQDDCTCTKTSKSAVVGLCCWNKPKIKRKIFPVDFCPNGNYGECSNLLGPKCRRGTTCKLLGRFEGAPGLCCFNIPIEERCPSGVFGPKCSRRRKCRPGYTCRFGFCCKRHVCPNNWIERGICDMTTGQPKCQQGCKCVDGFCCRVPDNICPSGVIGPVCSEFAPCEPGYTCRFGFCCLDPTCPKDWIEGGSCNDWQGQPKCKEGYECINNVCCRATFCPSGSIGPVCSAQRQCRAGYRCRNNYCCREPVCPNDWAEGGGVCNLTPGQPKCMEGYQCFGDFCCRVPEQFCPSGVIGPVCSEFEPCEPGYTCRFGFCCLDPTCPKDWIEGGVCNDLQGQPKCKEGYECINNVCCRATFCPSGSIGPVCSAQRPCRPGYSCRNNYCCREPVCPKNCTEGGGVCNLIPGQPKCMDGYQCVGDFCCRIPEQFCPSGVIGPVCSEFTPCEPGYTCRFGFCCLDPTCPKDWIEGGSCNDWQGQPKCKEGYECINNVCCRATFCPSGSIGPVCSAQRPCRPGYSCRNNYCCREPVCPNDWAEGGGVCNLTPGQPKCMEGYQCFGDFCCRVPEQFCPSGVIGPVCSEFEPCEPGYTCRFGFCCLDPTCPKDWIEGGVCNDLQGQPKCKEGYECINNICCRATFCPSGSIGPVCSAQRPCRPGYSCRNNYCCREPVCPKNCTEGGGVCNLIPGQPKCMDGYQCVGDFCCRIPEQFCPSGVIGPVCSEFTPCEPGYTCRFGFCCLDPTCPKDWIEGGSCNNLQGLPKCEEGYECINNVCCRAKFCPSGSIGPVCSAQIPCRSGYSCRSNYCCREPVCPNDWAEGGGVCNLTPGQPKCMEGYQCFGDFCCRVPEQFCPSGVIGPVCSEFAPCEPGYTCRFGFCCLEPTCPKDWIEGGSCNNLQGQPKCREGYECINNVCCRATFCPSGSIGPVCSAQRPCRPGYSCRNNYCCREPVCPNDWIEGGGVCNLTPGQPKCMEGYQCFGDFCCRVPEQFCPSGVIGPVCSAFAPCEPGYTCRFGVCCLDPTCPKDWKEGGLCNDWQGQSKCKEGYECINNVCCRANFCPSGSVGPVCTAQRPCKPGYSCRSNYCCREPVCPKDWTEGGVCNLTPGQPKCMEGYQCVYDFCCRVPEQFCPSGVIGSTCSNFEPCEPGYTCRFGFCCRDLVCPIDWIEGGLCNDWQGQSKCKEGYECINNVCCRATFCPSGSIGPVCSAQRPCKPGYSCRSNYCCREPVCPKDWTEGGVCNLTPGQPKCMEGYQCVYDFCCRVPEQFCPSGVIGPVCSNFEPCEPGFTCRYGFCCRDSVCPKDWIEGGSCNDLQGQPQCKEGYECISKWGNGVCCRRAEPQLPVCKLPKDTGPCLVAFPRWFYNFETKACELFKYGGCGGNANNFERKEDCEKRCGVYVPIPPKLPVCKQPKMVGPCYAAIPRWFYNFVTQVCEQFIYGGCQGNENNFGNKEECEIRCGVVPAPKPPGCKDCTSTPQLPVCEQPKVVGPCYAAIPRWFYNFVTKVCELFIYGGCQGNDNNFGNKEECEKRCGVVPAPQLPVCKQPKEVGPCFAAVPRWFYNFVTQVCELFIYGGCQGNENNFGNKEECEITCGVVPAPKPPGCKDCTSTPQLPVCEQPKVVGPCYAAIPRWFYNFVTKVCELFIYGGCQGNDNNFGNKEECEKRCGVVPAPQLPVCKQPKEVGPCFAAVPRWFYNFVTQVCELFIYGGCQGNENNFGNKEECEITCGVVPAPKPPGCKDCTSTPQLPVCEQPKVVGPCYAAIPRWFYNFVTKVCELFIYGGCQGNDNNFGNKEECEKRCGVVPAPQLPVCKQPKEVGPCFAAVPRWFYNFVTQVCELFIYGGCQGNENNFGNKEECDITCGVVPAPKLPGCINCTSTPQLPVCEQPKMVGPCNAEIPRWFYNFVTKVCQLFIYGGCQGNENNFGNKEECEKRCGVVPAPQIPVCKQPKEVGPCFAAVPRWFYNFVTQVCELFIYGGCQGNDNNFGNKEECEITCGVVQVPKLPGCKDCTSEPQLPVCKQPKEVGPCFASVPRWFYNFVTQVCEQFIYGGCQGNDNNFGSKEECEKYCGVVTAPQLPVCKQPKEVGPCRAAVPRWFYNFVTEVCEQFIYGGCQGNDNNFGTKEECETRCGVVQVPKLPGCKDCTSEPQLPVCKQPKEVGPCFAAIPRWFYNFVTEVCEQFIYGGCQGNDNNFGTKEECEIRCGVVLVPKLPGCKDCTSEPQLPVCKQPKEVGPCFAAIPRWFYNFVTEVCEQFIYGGCQGNDNNFGTKEECEIRCDVVLVPKLPGCKDCTSEPQLPVCKQPKEVGPCFAAIPRWFYNFVTEVCEQFIYGGCQGNDNNFGTKEECEIRCGAVLVPKLPGCKDCTSEPQLPVCKQPKEVGPCFASVPRWFYNFVTEVCEQFIYGGCQGNDNNFGNKEECEKYCGVVTAPQLPVCQQPKVVGPCLAAVPRWFYNSVTRVCEQFTYGGCQGNENNFGTKQECEMRCTVLPAPKLPVCEQPKIVGPCFAAVPRWFYNSETKRCERFTYGGCQGNDNNFGRKEECERRCGIVPAPQLPVCQQPMVVGPCLAAVPRWFYNSLTRVCEQFTYGGCQGNENNFGTKQECEMRCTVLPGPQLPVCEQPKNIGSCDGAYPRWFFNSNTNGCEEFNFGGCEANDNNFERKEDCERRCGTMSRHPLPTLY